MHPLNRQAGLTPECWGMLNAVLLFCGWLLGALLAFLLAPNFAENEVGVDYMIQV